MPDSLVHVHHLSLKLSLNPVQMVLSKDICAVYEHPRTNREKEFGLQTLDRRSHVEIPVGCGMR